MPHALREAHRSSPDEIERIIVQDAARAVPGNPGTPDLARQGS